MSAKPMLLNAKDVDDLGEVIYWLSAAKADLNACKSTDASVVAGALTQDELAAHALECINTADAAVERVLTGANRTPCPLQRKKEKAHA